MYKKGVVYTKCKKKKIETPPSPKYEAKKRKIYTTLL